MSLNRQVKKKFLQISNYLTNVNEFEQVWIKFGDTNAIFSHQTLEGLLDRQPSGS